MRHTEETKERARELRAQGLSYLKISQLLGVTDCTVRRWVAPGPYPQVEYRKRNLKRYAAYETKYQTTKATTDPDFWKKKSERGKQYRSSPRGRSLISLNKARHAAKKRGHAPCTSPVDELIAAWTGFCADCGVPDGAPTLHMDHDHVTGEFRGWVCASCNQLRG